MQVEGKEIMKKLLMAFTTLLITLQSVSAMTVDEFIDKHIAPVTDRIADVIFYSVPVAGGKIPLIIFWILFAGIFFTIYYKGISIWGLKHAIDNLLKKSEKSR